MVNGHGFVRDFGGGFLTLAGVRVVGWEPPAGIFLLRRRVDGGDVGSRWLGLCMVGCHFLAQPIGEVAGTGDIGHVGGADEVVGLLHGGLMGERADEFSLFDEIAR